MDYPNFIVSKTRKKNPLVYKGLIWYVKTCEYLVAQQALLLLNTCRVLLSKMEVILQ